MKCLAQRPAHRRCSWNGSPSVLLVAPPWPPVSPSVHYNLASFTITPVKGPSPRACVSATKFKGSLSIIRPLTRQLFTECLLCASCSKCRGCSSDQNKTKIPAAQRKNSTDHSLLGPPDIPDLEAKPPWLQGRCCLGFPSDSLNMLLHAPFLRPPLRPGVPLGCTLLLFSSGQCHPLPRQTDDPQTCLSTPALQ